MHLGDTIKYVEVPFPSTEPLVPERFAQPAEHEEITEPVSPDNAPVEDEPEKTKVPVGPDGEPIEEEGA